MSLFQALIAERSIPPAPPSYNVMQFGPGNSRVGTRQLALEPSVSGVDRPMSWSCWLLCNNIGTQTMRAFCNMDPSSAFQQYSFNVFSQGNAALNQHANYTLFNTANTGTIAINSGLKFLRARWRHVVVTYDGSEVATGLKLYFNKDEDLAATFATTGTYGGAGSAAGYRFQAGAVLGGNLNGRMRDMAIWNRVLTPAEIVSLYNNGVPIDVDTLSFYATAIEAYWPMRTNANCLNNATFNLGTLAGVSFGLYPLGPNFNYLSMFNAIPTNTAYLAFGSWATSRRIYTRSGTDHVTSGVCDVETLSTAAAFSVSSDLGVITELPGSDLRNMAAGVDVSLVRVFSARYSGGVVTDTDYYDSTDGLTGLTFGARNDLTSILPVSGGLTYGKVCAGSAAGDSFVAWYSGNVAGTYRIGIIKETGGVFSYISVYSGGTDYVEAGLIYCGGTTFLLLSRRLVGTGLHLFVSTDDCATWSAPAATGLGTGVCMGDGCMMPDSGNIVLIYADRTTGFCYLSVDNVLADVLADPTDWNAGSAIFQKYTFGANILGYPGIVPDPVFPGCAAVFVSAEASATRADLFVGYGQIEFS